MTISASVPADDTGQYPALAGYAPATTGERIGGYVLDGLVGGALTGISLLPLLAALGSIDEYSTSDDVGGVLGIGFIGVLAIYVLFTILALYVLIAKGSRIGAILLGLQNVDVNTGRVSGGKTFAKYLLQSLVIGLTLGLGMIVLVATIRPGLGRNWFDRTAGVVVINNRRGRKPGAPAPAQRPADADRMPPPPIQQVGFPGSGTPVAQGANFAGGPGAPTSGSWQPVPAGPPPSPASPLDSWQPIAGPAGFAASSAHGAPVPAPASAPPAPPVVPNFPAAPASDPASGTPGFSPPPAPDLASGTPGYSFAPAPDLAPGRAGFSSPPPFGPSPPAPANGFEQPVPWVREMRPPEAAVADPRAGAGPELDRTLARSFTSARIRIDNGEVLDIDAPVLLGRNPGQLPGYESARLVPVADQERSISKTHLAVGPDGRGVWVEDLNSMNGLRVTSPGGTPTKAVAGQRYPVPPGGRVEFGDRSFIVVDG